MVSSTNRNIVYAYILCIALAGLLCFAQIKANLMLIYLCLLAFLIIIAYSATKDFALPVLLFYLPWSKILRASPTMNSFFTVGLLLVCVINLIVRKFWIKRYPITVGIVLALLTLLSKLLDGNQLSLDYIMFLVMLVLFPMVKEEQKTKTYDFFVLVLFLSTGVIMAALCAQQFAGYSNVERYIRVDSYLTITRRCGFYGDPNFYSAQITAAMAGCMILILQIKNGWKVTLLSGLLILLLYCGLLSASKSFIVVFLSMLLLWLYMLGKMRGRGGLKTILIIGVLAFSLYISTSVLFRELIDVVLTRLSSSNNLSGFTTGRTTLWNMYLESITGDWKTFLFGVGYTNVMVNGYASHSTILQAWFQLGIIGSMVLAIWCVCFLSDGARRLAAGQRIYGLLLIIGVFLPWLAIDMLFFDEFFLFQIYVFIGLGDGHMTQVKESTRKRHILRWGN